MGRRRKGRPISGWLNFDKPLEVSSAQSVSRLRHLFFAQKAGHAGTLDSLATGILPLAFGEATKTVAYLMAADKDYQFTVRWGALTATDDAQGEIIEQSDHRPHEKDILAALPYFTGEIEQMPPVYSALKVNGKRAYALARAGAEVKLAKRRVHIISLRLLNCSDADHAEFSVTCTKGTYIRSLARDLAEFLGTKGHVRVLRRTRVGSFAQKDAITLEKCMDLVHIGAQARGVEKPERENARFEALKFEALALKFEALDALLLPLTTVLDDIPALPINDTQAAHIKMGRSILVTHQAARFDSEKDEAVVMLAGQPVAIGRVTAGRFHPTRVFNL